MHSDVESLLALQIEDQAIGEMEARLAALEPRLREMDVAHTAAVEALDRARGVRSRPRRAGIANCRPVSRNTSSCTSATSRNSTPYAG